MRKLMFLMMVGIGMGLVASANATIIDVSVGTDKPVYQLGENVIVSITAYNQSTLPVTLYFASSAQASYLMDGVYDYKSHHGAVLWVTERLIPGMSSYTWDLFHGISEMQTYPLLVGTHTITGEVIGYGLSTPIFFEVVPEPATCLLFGLGGLAIRKA